MALTLIKRYRQLSLRTKFNHTLLLVAAKILCLPLHVLPRRGRPINTKAWNELHPMSYLDGLRGYLSVFIYTAHVTSSAWKWIPDYIINVPWLGFPFRWKYPSLCLFFWISGYVVSYKAVDLMQTGQKEQLLDNLSSLAFRRYFRLLLPILPVVLVTHILVSLDIAVMPDGIAGDAPNKWVKSDPLWSFARDVVRIGNPFTRIVGFNDGGTGSKLLEHTWSLPAEYRSSMILCILCLASYRFSTRNRKLLLLAAVPAFVFWEADWAALAWIGMWFAECRQQRRRQGQSDQRPSIPAAKTSTLSEGDAIEKQALHPHTFSTDSSKSAGSSSSADGQNHKLLRKLSLLIMFLYSFAYMQDVDNLYNRTTFPHSLLNRWLPKGWHSQSKIQPHLIIGCTMMMYPLDRLEMLQRPLLTPFSQYLGELSFGIYAVHPTVKWIFWEKMYSPWIGRRCGAYAMDYFWCCFPGWLGQLICVIWAAEAFRMIDVQVIKFVKLLESQLFEK